MSKNDIWLFGFITIWIILTAGTPDILDGITQQLIKDSCEEGK
jgi:hypothetical protein